MEYQDPNPYRDQLNTYYGSIRDGYGETLRDVDPNELARKADEWDRQEAARLAREAEAARTRDPRNPYGVTKCEDEPGGCSVSGGRRRRSRRSRSRQSKKSRRSKQSRRR